MIFYICSNIHSKTVQNYKKKRIRQRLLFNFLADIASNSCFFLCFIYEFPKIIVIFAKETEIQHYPKKGNLKGKRHGNAEDCDYSSTNAKTDCLPRESSRKTTEIRLLGNN